jgi:hypothetical protein
MNNKKIGTPSGDNPVTTKTHSELGDSLHGHFNLEADRLKEREVRLAKEVKEARAYLDESADQFKELWLDWIDQSKKAVEEMRQLRMTLESERRLIRASLGDMKAAVEENQATLVEMHRIVDSLETISRMEETGFLSRLTDVCCRMIK